MARRTEPPPATTPLPESAQLYQLLVESVVDYAIFALDRTGHVLTWNRGAQRLKGYAASEIVGKHISIFYPPDVAESGFPDRELETAARAGRFEGEGWRVRKDGTRFWASVVTNALHDANGAVIGFAKVTRDLTARREAEENERRLAAAEAARLQAEHARDAATGAERLTREIITSIPDPFVVQDPDWRFRFINPAAAAVMERSGHGPAASLVGKVVWDVYPELRGTAFEREMRRSMRERVPVTFEAFYPERGEWSQMVCYPLPDGSLATQWRDITSRRKAEEAAEYLARASDVLASSLDTNATLAKLADLAVPELADWCVVDVREPSGALRRVAMAHPDPAALALARDLESRYPTDTNATTGVSNVLRTGQPELYPELTDELLTQGARDADHGRVLRELGLRSVILAPISARDRVHGVLTLVSSTSRRRYTDADLRLAMEIARRAGIAIDNAMLLRDAQNAAERMARLQAVTARLATIVTADDVGDTVLREGVSALGATHGALCVVTSDPEVLEIVSTVGLSEQIVKDFRQFRTDAPLPLSLAVRTTQAVFLEDRAEIEARVITAPSAGRAGVAKAWAAMPLMIGGHPIGGLALGFDEPRHFSPEDRSFAMALADQASQALERTRLYAAEQTARAEAEEANRAKSDFLATMSHELRTPLNAIAGYAELLEMGIHGPLSPTQLDAVQRIHRSELRLRALIEDVLSFARIEAGRLELDLRMIHVRDVIVEVETMIQPQLQAKHIAFSFVDCDASLEAYADAEKVQQILLNLVSNAVKFTAEGGRVSVRGDVVSEQVQVTVTDTGIGIPPEKLESIFEPFVQVGRSLTAPLEGSGLGLAISRDLARAMGGTLGATSEVGKGSVFTLTLPTRPA
jgi:PAS domain S-box-containing protein